MLQFLYLLFKQNRRYYINCQYIMKALCQAMRRINNRLIAIFALFAKLFILILKVMVCHFTDIMYILITVLL